MADVKLSQLAAVSPASVAAGAALWTLPGFIQGLRLVYTAANALRVDPGAATIQSLNYPVNVAAAIAKTGLTLTAATWYHVYLFMNGSTPDIEVVTTAPTAAYHGTARSKTGDTSRRYLGSVRSLAANTLAKFEHSPELGSMTYHENINAAPFIVLSAGTATAATSVSCTTAVPVTGVSAKLTANNNATGQIIYMSNSLAVNALSTTFWKAFINPAGSFFAEFPLDGSQAFNYMYDAAPAGGQAFIRVTGYVFER